MNISMNFFQVRGSWCLTTQASHHILDTSVNWMLDTSVNWMYIASTQFSFRTLATFKSFSILTIHCSAFYGPSVSQNIDGCTLGKSNTITVLSDSLDCNILSSNTNVVVWYVYAISCTKFLSSTILSLRLALVKNWIDIVYIKGIQKIDISDNRTRYNRHNTRSDRYL